MKDYKYYKETRHIFYHNGKTYGMRRLFVESVTRLIKEVIRAVT